MLAEAAGIAPARRRAGETGGFGFAALPAAAAGDIAPDWAALAATACDDNVFFHPDFVLPAAAHLDAAGLAIAAVRDDAGRLVAAAPFSPLRLGHIAPAVRLWAHKYAPLGLPLIARDAVAPGLAALVDGLAPEGSGLSLILPDIFAEGVVAAALVRLARDSGRPLASLGYHQRAALVRSSPASADLRSALHARRRKELGRQLRRLADLGAVSLETASEPEDVRRAFEEFLALEQAGWKGRIGTALASAPASAAFAREAVARRSESAGVRIETLRLNRLAVAAVVSFVSGATAWTWKIAHDESFARFSPGAELMLEAPARIFADPAVMQIDSCAAAHHPMIDRLWPDRLAIATCVLGPPGGNLLFRLGLAAEKAEVAARANARHLRYRLG